MARGPRQQKVSGQPAATPEALLQMQALLQQFAVAGLRGVVFTGHIGRDGTVAVTTQELEPPEAGALPQLAGCDLRRLPISGLIAFSTRAARRCLPIALSFVSKSDDAVAIGDALRKGEDVATGHGERDLVQFSRHLDILHEFVASFPAVMKDSLTLAAAHAATAVFRAVYCAYQGIQADGSESIGEAVAQDAEKVTFEAAVAGAHAAEAILPPVPNPQTGQTPRRLGASTLGRALATDYARIVGLKAGDFPNRGDAVDPSEDGPLGALWPEGMPAWYSEGFAKGQQWAVSQSLVPIPKDVEEFCRQRGVLKEMSLSLKAARECFPEAKLTIELLSDPQEGDRWVALTAFTTGTKDDLYARYQMCVKRMAQIMKWPDSALIRVTYVRS